MGDKDNTVNDSPDKKVKDKGDILIPVIGNKNGISSIDFGEDPGVCFITPAEPETAVPPGADLVEIRKDPEDPPFVFRKKTIYKSERQCRDRSGPPMVNSKAYQDGWGRIFGREKEVN